MYKFLVLCSALVPFFAFSYEGDDSQADDQLEQTITTDVGDTYDSDKDADETSDNFTVDNDE